MIRGRRRGVVVLALGVMALAPASASAALPSVSSGALPGPPVLYADAPNAPQLSNTAPFSAAPLLVSGTDAYSGGEYVYQDYLFDDRGADTVPLLGSRPDNLDSGNFSPTAGDVQYPTGARYAGNAADLVEFRVKPTANAIVYRITLNSVVDPDTTVVGIGIDTDRSGGAAVAWPNGADMNSPGLDQFITAWGTGGEVTSLPGGTPAALPGGAVTIDTATKQMTISVPRPTMDPGTATWRYVTGLGLWDAAGHQWKTPATGISPTADQAASGNPVLGASGVFNLGFRFDEPQIKQPGPDIQFPFSTAPGVGNWFEDKQSVALASRTTAASAATGLGLVTPAGGDDFVSDIDFAKLAAATNEPVHAPGRKQARIFASGLDLPQGFKTGFPEYGGQLQPYILNVPTSYDAGTPTALTFALHSLGGTFTQHAVFSPNQLTQLGDERGNLLVTPMGHGPDGWYTDEGETDVFEVWADVNRHFNLDPDRSYVSGYSMGGYGSYKLGVEYPDLWAKAFTTVGPPAEGIWIPGTDPSDGVETLTQTLLENVRWVPFLNWAGSTDELVPVVGPLAQQQRFDQLGLRSELWIFAPADHFVLAILDGWAKARDFLGDATVKHDPSRVDYGFFPAADRPALGLVHNHAYWVSDLVARDLGGPGTVARISARSLAFGEGDPTTAPVTGGGIDAGPPIPYVKTGTTWTGIPSVPEENALEVNLNNIGSGTIEGTRAQLDGTRELRVAFDSNGASQIRFELALGAGATAVRVDGGSEVPAAEVTLDGGGASFDLPEAGQRTYLIRPALSSGGGGSSGTGATAAAPRRCTSNWRKKHRRWHRRHPDATKAQARRWHRKHRRC